MRLLFASVGAYGHLYPVIPLALAARDLGHDVSFATAPQFHPVLRAAGLKTVAAGGTIDDAFRTAFTELGGPPADEAAQVAIAVEVFSRMLTVDAVKDLSPVLKNGAFDLVVYEVGNRGAGIAADLAGVPAAIMSLGRVPEGPLWEDVMFPAFAAIATEFGLKIRDPLTYDHPYIDICPASLQAPSFARPTTHVAMRPVAWNPPGALPPVALDRDPTRPLVYLTLGTTFAQAGLFRQMATGLARLPIDAIIATGPAVQPDELTDLPPNVTVAQWVPQADLLRHVDLVIHHGGSGTFLGALAQGLPQLILPQGADQFSNAQVLVDAGLGEQILPPDLTPDALADRAQALLLNDPVLAAARRLAEEISLMPTPEETLGRLTEFVL
jgi:UDP:flavonoid glycosyltransferase YjiC (YdhE family)